ncbi:MAG: UPF0149 family protein [Chlorobium sp.]|nr:MAG: UPF0149 family protein [Chlorobium sp.]
MTQSDPLQEPLIPDEIDLLEGFFLSDLPPSGSLSSLEMVEGYMTALVVGPEVVEADDWLPYIFDQEGHSEPSFVSDDDAVMIEELLLRYMNTVERQFNDDPDGFSPLYEQFDYGDEEAEMLAIQEWALGFMVGMEMKNESWKPLFANESTGMLGLPMLMLSNIAGDKVTLSEEEIADMIELMPEFVVKIYHFWKLM